MPPQPRPDPDAPKRPALKPLLALKPYVLRYHWMVAATIVALAVSALAMLTLPLAVRRMIDFGFGAESAETINTYFLALLGVGAVLAVASASRFFCVQWLGERIVADLRRDVFQHLTLLSPAFYEQQRSGELMSRLTADTTQIKSAVGVAVSQSLRNLVMLFGALTMMIVTSRSLSGLVVIAIPLIVLPLIAYGRTVRKLSRKAQDTLADSSAYAAENISEVRTLQSFTNEIPVLARYGDAIEKTFQAARSRMIARAFLTASIIFLVFASIVGILWYGASEVLAGTITPGTLSQFVLYSVFAAGALGELSEVWGEIQQAAGSAERLVELLNVKPEITSPEHPVALPVPAEGRISFDDVSFSYPTRPEERALYGVSFEAAPGETLAIVGPSGGGKSTIFALLNRFYDPTRGTVTIDGVDIATGDLAEVRARLAVVPQDVALFADTALENIRYGRPDASEAEVFAAAKVARADTFISELPDGYGTLVGERGVTLSGGQRQRIAIARAVLRDAPILLLDEATSALDATNETEVQAALERIMADRTTLVIAHRLATIRNADHIPVMDGGRMVEEGTHAALSARGGLYGRLAAQQFGEAAE
ncbi:MAG: ABC transporter transmembrane domain-containing protein [Hyphomicrobiaceae bacterium]